MRTCSGASKCATRLLWRLHRFTFHWMFDYYACMYLPLLFLVNNLPYTYIVSFHAYIVINLLLSDFDCPSVARKCFGDTTRKSQVITDIKSGSWTICILYWICVSTVTLPIKKNFPLSNFSFVHQLFARTKNIMV